MDVYEKALLTVLLCHGLFVAISLPLMLRRVPPNRAYGYRTRATLTDERIWYEANAYFGRWFIIACATAALGFFALFLSRSLGPTTFLRASIVDLVAPALVTTIMTSRFVHSLLLTRGGDPQR
jgi:uncharacterized membrane protein